MFLFMPSLGYLEDVCSRCKCIYFSKILSNMFLYLNFSNSEKIKIKLENCCYSTNIYTQNLLFSFKTAQKLKVHIDEIWRNTQKPFQEQEHSPHR